MIRSIRLVLGGLAILAVTSGDARSQYYYPSGYGYGGYGFGGWGGTPQGSYLRGLGAYAEGEGVYNYDSAVANSINTDTATRFNQYLWNSELEARRIYNSHLARRMNLNKDQYKVRQRQMRENPLPGDIESGEALNMILHELTDPKVLSNTSALRLANAKVSARTIREIPFRDETDAITLSLDDLTDPKSWPTPLKAESFTPEREAYQKAVDDALAEDKEGGTLKPETVSRVRNAVAALYRKVEATIPKTQQPDHLDAVNYLKGLAGLSRMLERPNVESVIAELEKIENTTLGNLVAFMHTYNLRFGTATTPKQRSAYRELYPLMVAARDKIVPKPQEDTEPAPAAPVDNPTAVFYGLDPAHLNPKAAPANQPPPPAPTPANPTPPKP